MPHKGFRHTWAIKGRGGAGRILALALLALLFVLVGACGGDDSAEAPRLSPLLLQPLPPRQPTRAAEADSAEAAAVTERR